MKIIDKVKKFFQSPNDTSKNNLILDSQPTEKQPLTEAEELNAMLVLSKELGIPPINLSKYLLDIQFVTLIPEEIARTYQVVILVKTEQELTVAISDPFNITAIDTLKSLVKTNIHLVLATPSDIIKTIDKFYTTLNVAEKYARGETIGKSLGQEDKQEIGIEIKAVISEDLGEDINEITKISQEESIVTTMNDILLEAVKCRASDIHIEPYLQELRLRYRIDGILHDVKSLPTDVKRALTARIKIMSNLDITQRRLPQDGRISLSLQKRKIDCRVSVLPTSCGEKIVLRLLERRDIQIDLEELGFSTNALEAFTKAMARPYGMILLTGPTGSGKSTTLYALLNTLDKIKKNIITIEDPVEYQMQGITQIQIKPEIELTFANSLRTVLRQNPNVIMVGEIRDFETVDIAMKAALTGHLILSTLHTNDAPSAITRLMNMQVEPFLISSTLLLIVAQRLCRRICESCKVPYEISVANLIGLPPDFKENKAVLYRGKGCQRCNNTGYFDRMPVVQALFIDDSIKDMILKRASLNEVRECAHSKGMKTLREDAIEKVLKGNISLEEALRITPEG